MFIKKVLSWIKLDYALEKRHTYSNHNNLYVTIKN